MMATTLHDACLQELAFDAIVRPIAFPFCVHFEVSSSVHLSRCIFYLDSNDQVDLFQSYAAI